MTREQILFNALLRAEKDLRAICDDEQGKIDPSFALERITAALEKIK